MDKLQIRKKSPMNEPWAPRHDECSNAGMEVQVLMSLTDNPADMADYIRSKIPNMPEEDRQLTETVANMVQEGKIVFGGITETGEPVWKLSGRRYHE